jgi:release factor glutamine methyltransferase
MFLRKLWLQPKKNAIANNVDVTFINQNILETVDLQMEFDIVSNPPYVRNIREARNQNVFRQRTSFGTFC